MTKIWHFPERHGDKDALAKGLDRRLAITTTNGGKNGQTKGFGTVDE